jgi:hypothetical protein
LLPVELITGVLLRAVTASESGDPRHWSFPSFEALLPPLREQAWSEILSGHFVVEAIKGVRGKRRRTVLPAELPRLIPDWELSRLCLGKRDEFIDVRVRHAPAEPVKKAWRERPDRSKLKVAMENIAQRYPPGARPPFSEIWGALKVELGQEDLPWRPAKYALKNYAPHLEGRRGHRSSKGKSPG